jgi:PKD domain
MNQTFRLLIFVVSLVGFLTRPAGAFERPDLTFKIFQFPADQIPRIDGHTEDWDVVPESYVIGTNQLVDDSARHAQPDPKNLEVRVRVGWVKGLNRLYFLYEASDNYWDFSRTDLHNDTFEIVVDGDASGGPLIDRVHPNKDRLGPWEAYRAFHGVHAQNYHIFTPAIGKDWCLAWGAQPWIKELPWANSAQSFNFKPGESGKYTLEFWITPFDYAGAEGAVRAVESVLREDKLIGLSWAIIDYDDVAAKDSSGFWNLSRKHTMYGNATELCAFQLMPLEPALQKKIDARWSFKVLDQDRRLVAFQDESNGRITSWKWDFGDGTSSTEQHPLHTYKEADKYIVTLYVEGPDGTARRAKVWDVAIR